MSRRKNDNNGNGKPKGNKDFETKTRGQEEYVRAISESDITFCTGPAGTGKTACAVGLACDYLKREKVNTIVVTRPIVETGRQGLGFLPGTMEEKIHPYLVPIMDEMYMYLGRENTRNKIACGDIRIVPLEVMRGYNFHRSFIILDEAQNATIDQLKMLITRIGRHSKVVITGDISQSDLYDEQIGLKVCLKKLVDIKGVSICELTHADIYRNSIISKILEKLS
jgi:phosphate starvation-inducible PhoH-like protein